MNNKYKIIIPILFLFMFFLVPNLYAATINVGTEEQLYGAALSPLNETIKLTNDIVVESDVYPQYFTIQDIDRTLDLNGHTLTINNRTYIQFKNANKTFTITDSIGSGKIICNTVFTYVLNEYENNNVLMKDFIMDFQDTGGYIFYQGVVENPVEVNAIIDGVIVNTKTTPFGSSTNLLIKKLLVRPISGVDSYIGFYNDSNVNYVSDIVDPNSTIIMNGEIVTSVRTNTWGRDIYFSANNPEAYIEIKPASEYEDPVSVTFVMAEGNQTITVEKGTIIEAPSYYDDHDRYATAWYTEPELTNIFDFSLPVNNSVTLYPLMVSYYDCYSYNETDDTLYSGGRIKINDDTPYYSPSGRIEVGYTITAEAIPDEGFRFVEWRTSKNGPTYSTNPSIVINTDEGEVYRYAVFVRSNEPEKCTVTFNCVGGIPRDEWPEPVKVNKGGLCPVPEDLPQTYDSLVLEGVYKDSGCTELFEFESDTITEDITLYCKYVPDSPHNEEISSVDVTIIPPTTNDSTTIGKVDGDWDWNNQTGLPDISVSDTQKCDYDISYWIVGPEGEDYDTPYIGVFEEDQSYYLEVYLYAKPGHSFSYSSQINVTGAEFIGITCMDGNSIAFTCRVTPTNAEPSQYKKGDLDRNNVIDANDASIALELYKAENATAQDIQIGDMDENGLIDANDASLILELYKTNN